MAKAGQFIGIAVLALIAGNRSLQTAVAEGDTRTISFHHVHTGEDITITYKRNGRYDDAALRKLDWFMRDWRKSKQVDMDPHLFDLLWEVNREVGGTQPIQVICGYRAPDTNAMLRARSSGVAQYSMHTKGDAIDFFLPGVPLEKIREVGLRLQRGGVGFYPTSGSPFVHLDTGSIRHWPRMTRQQLVKVFPDGRTVHIPSDGKPLPGYALALAEVERHGSSPSALSLAQAREAGAITAQQEQLAERTVEKPAQRSLLAIFDFGSRGENANEKLAEATPTPPAANRVVPAKLSAATRVATTAFVPMPKGRPALKTVVAELIPTPHRRPALSFEVASADPSVTASTRTVLAYAAADTPLARAEFAPQRIGAMGETGTALAPAAPQTSSVAERWPVSSSASTPASYRFEDPWLRATVLTPSVTEYMTALRTGHIDTRQLEPFLFKPKTPVVLMSFSDDPNNGLRTDAFSGHAVVFLATLTSPFRTAALQR